MAFVDRTDGGIKGFKGQTAALKNKLMWMEVVHSRGEAGVEGKTVITFLPN